MGLFSRWSGKNPLVETFNGTINDTQSVEAAFAYAVFGVKAQNSPDFSPLFALLNKRVVNGQMNLFLREDGALRDLDDITIDDCFPIVKAQLDFIQQYPDAVQNLSIYIPFALNEESAKELSAMLQKFFEKTPAKFTSLQLRLAAANKQPLSANAGDALNKAMAVHPELSVELINIGTTATKTQKSSQAQQPLVDKLVKNRDIDPPIENRRLSSGSQSGMEEHNRSPGQFPPRTFK
ncbi:MAG: hypothetical protein WC748_04280 [Legionellales bacterium]|jgi:hypothetical protein